MRFITFDVEVGAVSQIATSMNWKSLKKKITRHFSVTWRAARWDPGAFSAAGQEARGLPPVLLLPLQPVSF